MDETGGENIPEQQISGDTSLVTHDLGDGITMLSTEPTVNLHEVTAEPVETETPQEEVHEEAVATEEPLPQGVKKRINKFYAEKRAAEERARQAERVAQEQRLLLQQLQMQYQLQQQPANSSSGLVKPNPNEERYKANPLLYTEDAIKYAKYEAMLEMQQQQQQTQQASYYQQLENVYNEKIEDARARYDDFDETLENVRLPQNNPLSVEIAAAIQESENSADIVYHLGKNPHEINRLLGMSPRVAALQIGKLSAQLSSKPGTAPTLTRAPAPPKPVKGAATVKGRGIHEMSIDEVAKLDRTRRF